MRNLLITQSGGTTPVINSTIAGILEKNYWTNHFDKIYAAVPGLEGILNRDEPNLKELTGDVATISDFRYEAGSALTGTSRIQILGDKDIAKFKAFIEEYSIAAFVNIGGNGTIKQSKAIAAAIPNLQIAAAPKTVDNDLGDLECKDVLYNPGFPTCVNHWMKVGRYLINENRGAYSHDSVLVAQTFGRETGFLAGACRLLNISRTEEPIVILLPEDLQSRFKVLSKIDSMVNKFGRCLVFMSEGYEIDKIDYPLDKSGQKMYGSGITTNAQMLVHALVTEAEISARSYIPTILQRQCHDDILRKDEDASFHLGEYTAEQLMRGNSEFLSSINSSYDRVAIPFSRIENYSRKMQDSFIQRGQFDVSDNYIDYLSGLL
jgi:6-phosphofructokinase 1